MSDFATLWTVAHQAPLSMGFSRQEYCCGCHALLQGIFPTQGSNLHCCVAGGFFTTVPLGKLPGTDLGLKKKKSIHYNTTEYLGFLVPSHMYRLDTLKRLVLCPLINLSVIG